MIDTIGIKSAGRRSEVGTRPVSRRAKAVLLCAVILAGAAAAASRAFDGAGAKDALGSRALAPGGPMAFETPHGIITRFAAWARASARAGRASCAASASEGSGPGSSS